MSNEMGGGGDADSFDDWSRGRALGHRSYRPGLFPSGPRGVFRSNHLELSDFRELSMTLVSAGMEAAAFDPPVRHLEQFVDGIRDGLEEAHAAEVAEVASHSEKAQCDPSDPFGLCDYCAAYADAVSASHADRARWNAELQDPSLAFVVRSAKSMVHTRDCPTTTKMVSDAEHVMKWLTPGSARHGGVTAEWPHALTYHEALVANRRRCRVCVPDLPERTPAVRKARVHAQEAPTEDG